LRQGRFISQYQIASYAAAILISDKALANFFEHTVKLYPKAPTVANWLLGDIMSFLNENKKKINDIDFTPAQLAEILGLIDQGTLSGKLAKEVLVKVLGTGKQIKDIISESGMTQISDQGEIEKLVAEVINNNPKPVEEYKKGKETAITFLVGQLMKASKGRVNPKLAGELLKKALSN
jgi:aspartyl-tRNA(Asn)/glutamyl-tRNA(Gln) amidotransferase subunit B